MPEYPVPDNPVELPEQPETKKADGPDEELLREIRQTYKDYIDYWRENRENMEINMRFAGGDAFSPDEHALRDGYKRPCETPDELSQYVKQTNNNLRQSKRDCKISPADEDATGEDAEKREAVLRGLNHRGNFQACFQTAFEACTWCGFGYFGISIVDIGDGHLEPRPRRIANQFSVLLDPYCKQADYSDQKRTFVLDRVRWDDYREDYPNATHRSFAADDYKIAPEWVSEKDVLTAEYWCKKDGKVTQYITNGLEILDEIPWVGSWIPIIPILGEEIYVSESGKIKRMYLSLIHRARTPQKMLAFIASAELEEFGMAPRSPFIGYKGQFTSPDWATINVAPKPYIEVEALPDPLNPQEVLPLPTRPQFEPNAQAYEMAREAWRRAVQAAIGIAPLPTAAQRQNEKSGIALEKIQTQEAAGSYHLTDNGDRALVNYGRQANELISKVMTGPRHVGTKEADDTSGLLHLTTSDQGIPNGIDEKDVLFVDRGEFDLTFTTGPSHESQRDDASEFVDTLLQNIQQLPIPQPVATKILAIAIRLKNVGPKGDQIADLLDPEQGSPQEQAAKAMQQLQQQQAVMGELQQELQKLKLKEAGHVIDNQFKLQIEQLKTQANTFQEKLSNDIKVLIAEIQAKSQAESERNQMYQEFWLENHGSAHELAMQKDQQAHELAAGAQAHQQALEQGAMGAQNDQDLAVTNAALQPPSAPTEGNQQ